MGDADGTPVDLLEWIGLVYEGPLEEVPWRTFLSRTLASFRAEAVTLILRRPVEGNRGLILGAGGRGPRWESAYAEKFFAIDPFLRLPLNRVITLDEITSFEAYEQSDFFHQFMKPTGNYFLMGFDAEFGPGMVVRFRVSRAFEEGNFNTAERRLCSDLVPHLARALRLFERLEKTTSQRDLYAGAVDQMDVAAILLDENCRVLEASNAANKLLDQNEALKVTDGILGALAASENRALRKLVSDTIAAHRGSKPSIVKALAIGPKKGLSQIGIVIRPSEPHRWPYGDTQNTVEVFIRSATTRVPASPEAIARTLGLTAAEALLTARLVYGARLAEASSALGISRNTARNQLASVFAKTGVSRQADLVRLVLESTEDLARGEHDT